MTDLLFVLGAPDPEMSAIASLLSECGIPYAYAVDATGDRVHPGSAYRAVGWRRFAGDFRDATGTRLVLVECDLPDLDHDDVVHIDHHRPGDPGYGRPPEEFLEASSIGQVVRLLRLDVCHRCGDTLDWSDDSGPGWVPTGRTRTAYMPHDDADYVVQAAPGGGGAPVMGVADAGHYGGMGARGDLHDWPLRPEQYAAIRLVAAADHCLAAAYAGQCPGVDPDALMRWRAETRAAHQGRSVDEVLADVEAAREALAEALEVTHTEDHDWSRSVCDGCAHPPEYADLRGQHIPGLPEAACREGAAYLATVTDRDGREKVVLGGCTTPELVESFMRGDLVEGLHDVYGDPARGFAGGYVSPAPTR